MSKPKPRETSPEALRWLVRSRNQIQDLLLRLDYYPNEPDGKTWQRYVGAAFSLWRAVFLCHDSRDLSRRLEPDAKQFLRKVIERNSIAFGDDIEFRAWTGGYYINNALYRLDMRASARPRHDTQRSRWEDAFRELDAKVRRLPDEP